MNEKVNDSTPSEIIQLFLTPYIEFSLMFGSKEKTLLDCACGNLYQKFILLNRFKSVVFVDKDIPPYLLSDLSGQKQLDLENSDLPFEDKSFDVVFSFETIEHLEEDSQKHFVDELIRVGKSVVIGSVSANGPDFIGDNRIYKKATGTNPFHKKEFSSLEWFRFFNRYDDCEFFHLSKNDGYFSVEPNLNEKYGFCNYVVLA